ncbi:MAG: protein-glutamate O-methyltransferase CheR, partial [Rhodospirillaceae bacterium]|nr:protein-glutamate O-methyltransferase CheR [Rhodospirillaceae bacterium]
MTPAASGAAVGASAITALPDFPRLKARVIGASGLEYYADKDAALAERAEHRRAALGCSASEYVRRLLDPRDDRELAALIDEITVGETYFFRYPSQFDALRQAVIPACVARRAGERRLRLWSAGCASGAEPYSLAILLRLDLAGLLAGWEVSILATDINRRALDQARVGVFSKWELRTVGAELRRRCFVPAGTQWRIRPEFRAGLRFERQNLAAEIEAFALRHAGDFDVILCRNVMIYFGAEVMRRVIRGLAECLAPGGWLLVGHAEPFFEIANILAPVAVAGATLYRKPESGAGAAARPPWTGAVWSGPALD